MSIVEKLKGILAARQKINPADEGDEILAALLFTHNEEKKVVNTQIIGPTPGKAVTEDVAPAVLIAMKMAMETFDGVKEKIVKANLDENQLRQLIYVDGVDKTKESPMTEAVGKILGNVQVVQPAENKPEAPVYYQ